MTKSSISASISVTDAEIAKVVLMPGDPLRAKHVAEHYLENPVCFNTVRNMLGYTGTYRGKKISVMGSGMGIPSMGLYATELYTQFDVDAIIRIGSAAACPTRSSCGTWSWPWRLPPTPTMARPTTCPATWLPPPAMICWPTAWKRPRS